MRHSEEFYRTLFEHSPDAILIIEDERFVECNPAAVKMLRFPDKRSLLERYSGGTKDGSLRAHPGEFSPPTQPDGRDSFEKADEMMGIAFDRGSHTFEWNHVRSDGEVFSVEVQLTPINRGDRRVLQVQWREIGERKQLEAELQRAQRLEAVGRLAGGIAHDFNNLLVVILGHAELLAQELAAAGLTNQAGHAGEIREAAERAAALTRQLLSFSRGQPIQPRPTDLVELLASSGSMLERLIGENIEYALRLPAKPVVVHADPSQIERMVVNLVTNARDAMPDGGRLRISLESHYEMESSSQGGLPEGHYALIVISDSGEGMDPEQIDQAFEPFYTTRQAGTGLGLATVRSIADQCGGRSLIESTPGQGTSVKVLLPLSSEKPAEKQDRKQPARSLEGNELILLAEDEDAIRELIKNTLLQRGYRVLAASDGAEALLLAEMEQASIDLVVTDVVMPRLSGPRLVEQLRKSRPNVKVIFMSGYAQEGSLMGEAIERNAEILEKPFSPEALLLLMRRTLDQD